MAKRGKTRKQKILADLRRKTGLSVQQTGPVVTTPVERLQTKPALNTIVKKIEPSKKHVATLDYNYLRGDLLKTVFLTSFIAVAELMVRFLVKGI